MHMLYEERIYTNFHILITSYNTVCYYRNSINSSTKYFLFTQLFQLQSNIYIYMILTLQTGGITYKIRQYLGHPLTNKEETTV